MEFYAYKGETPLDQLVPECLCMAEFALNSGRKIPAALMERLYLIQNLYEPLQKGQPIPPGIDKAPSGLPACAAEISSIHAKLCDIVAPARPHTILLLDEEKVNAGKFHFLGPVPLIRRMMAMAFFSLVLFLALSLSPFIGDPNGLNFSNKNTLSMLFNFAFLIASAALGSSFAALYQANNYVKNTTYDPKYDQSYWNRHLLGIMSGLILAFFIPIEALANNEGNLKSLGKPLLAILGGFSSAAVYRILSRLVSAMESLFKGDPRSQTALAEEQSRANAEQRVLRMRMGLANQLSGLRGQMSQTTDPQLKAELDQILHELFGNQPNAAVLDPSRVPGLAPTTEKPEPENSPFDPPPSADQETPSDPSELPTSEQKPGGKV